MTTHDSDSGGSAMSWDSKKAPARMSWDADPGDHIGMSWDAPARKPMQSCCRNLDDDADGDG